MTRAPHRLIRRAGPAVLATLVGFAVFIVGALPAAAHAQLTGTDPADGTVLEAAPETLTLTFNEPVRAGDDAVRVIDPDGERLDVTAGSRDTIVTAEMPAQSPTGTYVVSWQVTSEDGHPVTGAFTYSVGAPSTPAVDGTDGIGSTDPWTENAVRVTQALTYLGLLLTFGLVVFGTILAPPGVLAATRTRLRKVGGISAILAVAGSVLLLPLGAVRQDAGPIGDVLRSDSWTDQLTAGPGVAAGLVAGGLLVAWLATGSPHRNLARGSAALGGAGVALGSVVLVGHTRTFGPAWLVVPADLLHVVTAACWFGGLVAVALMLTERRAETTVTAADATLALTRFSSLAAGLVGVLAVAGVVLGWRVLDSWSALFSTGYGVTLLAKIGLVGVVTAVAANNRYRLLPRVLARSASAAPWYALRRTVRLEAGLVVAVVVVTGVLVSQNPAEETSVADEAPSPTATADLGDGTVTATLTPGTAGTNTLELVLTDADGTPIEPLEKPDVSMTQPDAGVGPLSEATTSTGAGRYETRVELPLPGTWELEVSVRVSEFENPVATIPLEVR